MHFSHCQELFRALNGDLVATASLADMLQNTGSHFRSLFASLLTGKTKFDYLKSEDESATSYKHRRENDDIRSSDGEEGKDEEN